MDRITPRVIDCYDLEELGLWFGHCSSCHEDYDLYGSGYPLMEKYPWGWADDDPWIQHCCEDDDASFRLLMTTLEHLLPLRARLWRDVAKVRAGEPVAGARSYWTAIREGLERGEQPAEEEAEQGAS